MSNSTVNDCIDLDLVDKVVALVPGPTWHLVFTAVITNLVDEMTSDVLEKLTGDPQGFDRAEEILLSYYTENEARKHSLIVDAFKLLSAENTLHLLDALQLDKYMEFQSTINNNEV